MDGVVTLPKKCSLLRQLENELKRLSEAKTIVESSPDLFDMEDMTELNRAFNEAFIRFSDQAKAMDMPNAVAHAASFAENINARLPFLTFVRSLENQKLTEFFESKQKRLALQAEEMLSLSLKANNVGVVQFSA
jgi:DNA-binding GntR family transcriptional regulator